MFFSTLWLHTVKSIIFFGLLYFVFEVDSKTCLSRTKSLFVDTVISSSVLSSLSADIFFEEFEEPDNEFLYFHKLGYICFTGRSTDFKIHRHSDFIFSNSLIQNHLLNLPPPIIS